MTRSRERTNVRFSDEAKNPVEDGIGASSCWAGTGALDKRVSLSLIIGGRQGEDRRVSKRSRNRSNNDEPVARERKPRVNDCQLLDAADGFHRRIGFRAAAVSSSRETRVECGASSTVCGSSWTSSAIDFIASINKSISSFDSL